jgi:hypothetical protein
MDESIPNSEDSDEGLTSEGQFLSPEDSRILLADLEDLDTRKLALGSLASEIWDEGSFVSPGEAYVPPAPNAAAEARNTREDSPNSGTSASGAPASELLSRIAKEVQAIKAELGALRSSRTAETPAPSAVPQPAPAPLQTSEREEPAAGLPPAVQDDIKRLLTYLDRLLESLPEDKVDEFARSEYFDLYRKVFEYFDLT